MKDQFKEINFKPGSLKMIQTIDGILGTYSRQGFTLSLRQLYYQLVSRAIVPENTERMYKTVGKLVSDGRLAGLLDWSMIEDRGRSTQFPYVFTQTDPAHQVRIMADAYTENKWEHQPVHIEVMVEKDALSGVIGPVCQQLQVAFTANKGYSSQSAMYEAGQRLELVDADEVYVIYLGDHDPSGIDMTRDVQERLSMFSRRDVEVYRAALNMDQIIALNPPTNPAKLTDSRATSYIANYGDDSWELDAIEPNALAQLVRNAVLARRDEGLWGEAVEHETKIADRLRAYAGRMVAFDADVDDEDDE